MSLYETRDCGHSEIVLSKKCYTCSSIKLLEEHSRYKAALELIAMPKRADGTYNLCREACEQIAKEALK